MATSYIPDAEGVVLTIEDSADILEAVGDYIVPALLVVGVGFAVLLMVMGILGWITGLPQRMLGKSKLK